MRVVINGKLYDTGTVGVSVEFVTEGERNTLREMVYKGTNVIHSWPTAWTPERSAKMVKAYGKLFDKAGRAQLRLRKAETTSEEGE